MEGRQNFTFPHLPQRIMSTAAVTFLFTPVQPQLLQQQAEGASRNTPGGAPCLAAISIGAWASRESKARPDGIARLL